MQIERKPLSFFKPDPGQPRKHFDDVELRLLGESLKVRQLQPVLARPDGTLLDGERRWRAATFAGLEFLDAILCEQALAASEIRIIQLTTDVHKASLRPPERARAAEELLALNPSWRSVDLAAHLKLDPGMVTKLLSRSKCIPAVQEAFDAGRLGISDVYAMSRVSEQEQHAMLAMKLNGASRDDLEAQVKKTRRPAVQETAKVSRATFVLQGGSVSVAVADGGILDMESLISQLTDLIRLAKASRDKGIGIKNFAAVLRDQAKRSNAKAG
jgi:ParB family transcriptional regulator, chromosome partitioning protein